MPTGAARDVEWAKVKDGFNVVDGWLQASKEDGPYALGQTPGFVDFFIGARLTWFRLVFGEDSEEWKDITSWNEGRWAAFAEGLKKYEAVDL